MERNALNQPDDKAEEFGPHWRAVWPGGGRHARHRFERNAFPAPRRPEEPLRRAALPGAIHATGSSGRDALTGTGIDGDDYGQLYTG